MPALPLWPGTRPYQTVPFQYSVHIQHEDEREYYALERLWKDCPEVDLTAVEAPARPGAQESAGGPADPAS